MYTCKTVHTIPYLLHETVLQLAGQTTSAAILRTQTNGDAAILTTGLPRALGGVHILDGHKSSVNLC